MSFIKHKSYAIVDCNNFFVSCERVFNPGLMKRPVVVLSNNDGCIVSRSDEAKALGIPMGAPAFMYQNVFKAHQVAVLSANFSLYGNLSSRVMEILKGFSTSVQIYSIDEAFLILDGDLEAKCRQIRSTIQQWLGLPVSIGVSFSKTLAKVAVDKGKKSKEGFFILMDEKTMYPILEDLAIRDIWGMGRATDEFLKGKGIRSALDFIQLPDQTIRKWLKVTGLRMANELRGIACLEIEETLLYLNQKPILDRLKSLFFHMINWQKRWPVLQQELLKKFGWRGLAAIAFKS